MYNQKQRADSQQTQINPKCTTIELRSVLNKLRFIHPLKCDQFLVSDRRGNSRMGVRALSRLNALSALNIQTTQLALMNRSTVISTRSRGSKCINWFVPINSTTNLNRHGVAGIDLLHILPANQMATQRVEDFNSFIKENQFRMNKDLEADRTNQSTPNAGNYQSKGKSIINNLQIEHHRNYPKSHACKNQTTFRAKDLRIVHQSIFSRTVEKQVA